MSLDVVVLAYCARGPYRHLRELVRDRESCWFPWGYARKQVEPFVLSMIERGTEIEIWQVDDSRNPTSVEAIGLGEVDFCRNWGDYLSLTIELSSGRHRASKRSVLEGVAAGFLAFGVNVAAVNDKPRIQPAAPFRSKV